MAGMLTPDGRFANEIEHPRLSWEGAKAEYVLAWPHESSTGRAIIDHQRRRAEHSAG